MNIYVIYQAGIVVVVTTLPRIVQAEFKQGADTVQLWRNDKLIKTFTSGREFSKYINPPANEDDEEAGGNDYEW